MCQCVTIRVVSINGSLLYNQLTDGELLRAEVACCLSASRDSDIIVFNLFALEGWHIANHLSVPCVAATGWIMIAYMTVSAKALHVSMQILACSCFSKFEISYIIIYCNVTKACSLMANEPATFWCKAIEDR